MKLSNIIASLVLISLVASSQSYANVNAPYQCALYKFDTYDPLNPRNTPICSCTIIHPYFVVTTCDCVHMHILSQNISRPILPQSLYVSGGNFSSNSFNVKYVKDAFCHPDFNMPTLENNIAVLELDRPFDLQSTRDEQWVELADRNTRYSRCSYSIFNATALTNNLYPFTVPKPSMVLNETACSRNGTYYSNGIEKTHFCAPYHFDHVFMCQLPQNQLRVSFDRGVGVICENKLAGILSIVLAGNNETNSTAPPCINTLQTTALFTRIDTHSTFCHNVIGSRTPEKTPEGQPVPVLPISKPYQNVATVPTGKPERGAASIMYSTSTTLIVISIFTCLFTQK